MLGEDEACDVTEFHVAVMLVQSIKGLWLGFVGLQFLEILLLNILLWQFLTNFWTCKYQFGNR